MKLFVAFLILIAMTGCPAKQPQLGKNDMMHRVQAGEPESDGWYTARSTNGGFTVRVPMPFNDASIEAIPKMPGKFAHLIGGKLRPGEISFSVVRSPKYKPFDNANDYFEDQIKTSSKDKLLRNHRRSEVLGYPALDEELGRDRTSGYVRTLFLKDEIIMMIVTEEGDDKIAPEDAVKFFDSLTIDARDIDAN